MEKLHVQITDLHVDGHGLKKFIYAQKTATYTSTHPPSHLEKLSYKYC